MKPLQSTYSLQPLKQILCSRDPYSKLQSVFVFFRFFVFPFFRFNEILRCAQNDKCESNVGFSLFPFIRFSVYSFFHFFLPFYLFTFLPFYLITLSPFLYITTYSAENIDNLYVQSSYNFVVRSATVRQKEELNKLEESLKIKGYHPSIISLDWKNNIFYCIVMGYFHELTDANKLLFLLKKDGYDFIVQTLEEKTDNIDKSQKTNNIAEIEQTTEDVKKTEQLKALSQLKQSLPSVQHSMTRTPYSLTDQIKLLQKAAISNAANLKNKLSETAEKSEIIDMSTPYNTKEISLSPPAHIAISSPPTIKEKLRDIAWAMRKKGFSVYLEGETYTDNWGTLVGIFDEKEEANELKSELQSYGYSVNMVEEKINKKRIFVYAQQEAKEEQKSINIAQKTTINPPQQNKENTSTIRKQNSAEGISEVLLSSVRKKDQDEKISKDSKKEEGIAELPLPENPTTKIPKSIRNNEGLYELILLGTSRDGTSRDTIQQPRKQIKKSGPTNL